MILDTSALIAILRFEAEAPEFARIIESAGQRRISAVSYVETGAVIDDSKDPIAPRLRSRMRAFITILGDMAQPAL